MPHNTFKGKRLLILGGMRLSCEIVKMARNMGIVTLVADYNRPEDSPGKQIADEAVDLNITDVDSVTAYIQSNRIDGVIVGFNDMLLPYYAEICERTGLPCYGTKEQFETLIDKKKYKDLCRKFNVPCIPEYELDQPDIVYPVLVKPADNSGARGLTICRDPLQLQQAVNVAREYSRKGKFLIEGYMDGLEVTVFWIFQDEKYYLSGFSNRHMRQDQGTDVLPLPVGYTFPSVFLPKYRAEVEENCKSMFRHLGIRNGMMFMQCKVAEGTCLVYDIGFRLSGSLEYKLIRKVAGYDPLEMMIRFALTGKMSEDDLSKKAVPEYSAYPYNVSCLCAPGKIRSITGLDQVRDLPGVIDVVPAYEPGEMITERMRGQLSQIAVRVLGVADRKEEVFPAMRKIHDSLQIICEDGRDHLLPGIESYDVHNYIL